MTATTAGNASTPAPTSVSTNGHKSAPSTEEPDVVMMTPIKKEIDHTILRVERVNQNDGTSTGGGGGGAEGDKQRHVAGGQHQGIIINKQISSNGSPTNGHHPHRAHD